MLCPNINTQEWKDLEKKVGKAEAYKLWARNNFSIPNFNNVTPSIKGRDNYPVILSALRSSKEDVVNIENLALNDEHKTMLRDLVGVRTMSRNDLINELQGYVSYTIKNNSPAKVIPFGNKWLVKYPSGMERAYDTEKEANAVSSPDSSYRIMIGDKNIGSFNYSDGKVTNLSGGKVALSALGYRILQEDKNATYVDEKGIEAAIPAPAFFQAVETSDSAFNKLKNLLQESGISVTSINHWKEVTGKSVDDSITALADTANKLIAIKNGRASTEVLAEETAHMIIAAQEPQHLDTMLDLVDKLPEWKSLSEPYFDVYQGNERKVKMEVLGKILGEHIIKNMRRSKPSNMFVRLLRMLRDSWRRFIASFSPAVRLENYLSGIADTTINKGISPQIRDEGIFFSIDMSDYKSNFDGIIESLEQRMESLRRRNKKITVAEQVENLEKEISELKALREDDDYARGYLRFVEYLMEDLNNALSFVQKIRVGIETINATQIMQLGDFVSYYEPYVDALQKFLSFGDVMFFSDNELDFLYNLIEKEIKPGFDRIRHFRDIKREEQFNNIVREWWANELGISVNDTNFVDRVREMTGGYDLDDASRRLNVEGNHMQWWFGSLRDASDTLLRLVYAKVMRVDQRAHMSTLDFTKEVLNEADRLGIKNQDRLLERDKGKRTGFYIERTRRRAWNEQRKKLFDKLDAKYGIPKDAESRDVFFQQWEDFVASDPQGPGARTYKEYKEELSKWYKENTIRKDLAEINAIIAERKRILNAEQYKEWEKINMTTIERDDGSTYTLYKGELIEPSDGRRIGNITTVDWRNDQYDRLSDNEKEFLEYIKTKKAEIDAMLPGFYSNAQAPQLTDRIIDILRRKRDGMPKRLRDNIIDEITLRQAEDDLLFGEKTLLRPDGSKAKYVPIYYTRLLGDKDMEYDERLKETDKISTDLIYGLSAYHNMATKWNSMSKLAPEMELIAEQAGKREFQRKNKERIAGSDTAIQKQLRTFIDMQVYGMHVVGGEKWQYTVPENSVTQFLGLSGKTLSAPKFFRQLANYVRANNLGLNFFTTASNFIQAGTYNRIEDMVGQYTTLKSAAWSEKKFWQNVIPALRETGKLVKTNKMHALMELMGIEGDTRQFFANTDMSRLTRRAVETGLYFSYELISFWRNARVMMSVMHNYRKASDGKWYNSKEFARNFPDGDFNSLPNLYDLTTIGPDGKISMPIENNELLKIASRIKYVSQVIDGRLDRLDYAAAHQHFIANLMTIHRGWLIQGLQRRLRRKGINVATGDIEEGYWITTANFFKSTFAHPERMQFIRNGMEAWHNLSPMEKENLQRMMYEFMFAFVAMAVAVVMNGIADDDDDYLNDTLAYMSNRALMEIGAFVPPIIISEISNTINSPIVPMRQVELMFDINDMFFGGDIIESGQWKGFSKRERAFYRMIPGVKGLALIRDTKAVNQFLKNRPLRSVPYDLYGK